MRRTPTRQPLGSPPRAGLDRDTAGTRLDVWSGLCGGPGLGSGCASRTDYPMRGDPTVDQPLLQSRPGLLEPRVQGQIGHFRLGNPLDRKGFVVPRTRRGQQVRGRHVCRVRPADVVRDVRHRVVFQIGGQAPNLFVGFANGGIEGGLARFDRTARGGPRVGETAYAAKLQQDVVLTVNQQSRGTVPAPVPAPLRTVERTHRLCSSLIGFVAPSRRRF